MRLGMRAKCCGCTEAFQLLGRFDSRRPLAGHGEWRSLVAHPAGGRAVAGSNPVSPMQVACKWRVLAGGTPGPGRPGTRRVVHG